MKISKLWEPNNPLLELGALWVWTDLDTCFIDSLAFLGGRILLILDNLNWSFRDNPLYDIQLVKGIRNSEALFAINRVNIKSM